ncbi:MAG: hypothetical protein DWG80_03705 [Chloroflexi bacterium]|nr:MaoC family dehydratase [Chloroflexota bacterium]MQC18165.1 hypothetical protein [Chloroflexota bacterium]
MTNNSSGVTGTSSAQRYYEDVALGEEYAEEHLPTTEQVNEYLQTWMSSSGPVSGRFSNNDEAQRLGLARPIVPGNMSTAMISRTITNWLGTSGRVLSLEVTYRRPVFHNDPLRCVLVVIDAAEDDVEGSKAIIRIDVHLETEDGERPVQGTAEAELPRRT